MRQIGAQVKTVTVEPKKYVRFNPSIETPCTPHPQRARFLSSVARVGFSAQLVDKMLAPPTLAQRAAAKIGRIPARIRRLMTGERKS